MSKVVTELSVSLDGFVAGPNDSPALSLGEGGERLFAWYSGGDTALALSATDMVFQVSRASAELLQGEWAGRLHLNSAPMSAGMTELRRCATSRGR